MTKERLSPCIHCGKMRIITKVWQETVVLSGSRSILVTNTQTSCPDPECQKQVDEELAVRNKRFQEASDKRAEHAEMLKERRSPKAAKSAKR